MVDSDSQLKDINVAMGLTVLVRNPRTAFRRFLGEGTSLVSSSSTRTEGQYADPAKFKFLLQNTLLSNNHLNADIRERYLVLIMLSGAC